MVLNLTGCASTKAYFVDRGRDAADIVTVTVGTGMGATAKCTLLNVGLLQYQDAAGLRAGELFIADSGNTISGRQTDILIQGETDYFSPSSKLRRTNISDYKMFGLSGIPSDGRSIGHVFQVEVVAALGVGARLGLNPGELADFLVGLFGGDIFSDDLEARKMKKANKASEATSEPAPGAASSSHQR